MDKLTNPLLGKWVDVSGLLVCRVGLRCDIFFVYSRKEEKILLENKVSTQLEN